ncbi:Tyrosine phosphatase family protein [Roseivivax marinus]|uniref:phosphatase domain-containing putative toxin n=1 Tax=Roseivivax marinus TaxID=1379903 RepID=UPI0008AE57D5|nr:tyrosine-protein phosphatase [Roseivivax marinus]SEL84452.1 Tyrosine phosphatase family protein [Roseivivax marinus]
MIARLWTRVEEWERRVRRSFGRDIETRGGRAMAWLHYHLFDHAFLRTFWHNFHEVAPGVYRSNQPTARRFDRYAKLGIRTVVNLRGEDKFSYYLFEKEACARLGLTLVDAKLMARQAARRDRIVHVIDVIREAERPMVFHCKSGADRTGFVGAMYLLIFAGASITEAKKQLGIRYIHLDWTKTGIQDYILDVFAARQGWGEIGFEDWIRQEYDHKRLQKAFDARQPPKEAARPA